MKRSESSPSAEVGKAKSGGGKTITSLDGKRTISLEAFDRLFDEGSDEIDAFVDWKHPAVAHGGRRSNSGRKPSGRKPYQIRLRPEIHARLKKRAHQQGISLSELVETLVR
ncbi:MAG: toxin-antitoxin system HicB family antitoxin [Opitutales bacterium]|nr:toxin-antitoxin system HicB family antitoxin [Opitutales bacterium]